MLRPFLTVHPQTFKMCLLSCSCVPQRLDVVNFMQMLYHSRSLFYDSLCGWLTVTGTERWSFREKSCSLAQSELQLIVAHQSLEVHPSRWKLLWGGGLRGILHSFIVVAANHSKWPLTSPGSLTPCVLTNAISSCCVRRWIRSKADFCSPLLDRAPV